MVYIKGMNVNIRPNIMLWHILGRTNLSDVGKFGNMFRYRFQEKFTSLKFVHYKHCAFAKSVVSHILR